MSLQLDARQRAMLAEMGLRVFAPEAPVGRTEGTPPDPLRQAGGRADLRSAGSGPQPGRAAVVEAAAAIVQAPAGVGVELLEWEALRQAITACQACGLAAGRRGAVVGSGDPQADWLIVGEPPGEEEDLQGEPFAGEAGQLLANMLRAVGLQPGERVWLANVLRCRPPGNRNPEPQELAACAGFLRRQVQLVRPKVIVAMGRFAIQGLLQTAEPLGRLRGRAHDFEGVPVVATYHPLALLRNPAEKGKAWADLCLARSLVAGA